MRKNIIWLSVAVLMMLLAVNQSIAQVDIQNMTRSHLQEALKNELAKEKTSGQIISTYKVKKGDTLAGISAKVGVAKNDLVMANPAVDFKSLVPGTVIKYPVDLKKEINRTNSSIADLKNKITGFSGEMNRVAGESAKKAEEAVKSAMKPFVEIKNTVNLNFITSIISLVVSGITFLLVLGLMRMVRNLRRREK